MPVTSSPYCEAAEATASLNAVAAAVLKAWPWMAEALVDEVAGPLEEARAGGRDERRPARRRPGRPPGKRSEGLTVRLVDHRALQPEPGGGGVGQRLRLRLEATVPLRVIVWSEIVAVASV